MQESVVCFWIFGYMATILVFQRHSNKMKNYIDLGNNNRFIVLYSTDYVFFTKIHKIDSVDDDIAVFHHVSSLQLFAYF